VLKWEFKLGSRLIHAVNNRGKFFILDKKYKRLLANIPRLSNSRRKNEKNRGRKWKENGLVESQRAASSNGRRAQTPRKWLAVVAVKHLVRHGQCRFVVGSTTARVPRLPLSRSLHVFGNRIIEEGSERTSPLLHGEFLSHSFDTIF